MSVGPGSARRLTPPGPGAVAVLEVAGADALHRLARVGLTRPPRAGEIRLVRPRADGALLDEALLLRTAADRFELHVHASPPLVAELRERLGAAPEPGEPGEPPAGTVEERALALAPGAASELGARVLLAQAEGALRREVEDLRDARAGAAPAFLQRAAPLARLLAPSRVVLVGAVNAGKSTLFNALVGEARATVDAEAGTTRDALTARALLGPYPIELFDTAGARELERDAGRAADVEREGQALAGWLVERAELVLHVVPMGEPAGESPPARPVPFAPRILVRTKADPGRAPDDRGGVGETGEASGREVAVSALHDPAGAARRIGRAALAALGLPADPFPDPAVGAAFTPALADGLRAALERPPGPDRDRALAACLGSRPAR